MKLTASERKQLKSLSFQIECITESIEKLIAALDRPDDAERTAFMNELSSLIDPLYKGSGLIERVLYPKRTQRAVERITAKSDAWKKAHPEAMAQLVKDPERIRRKKGSAG